jgi:hypothetical protein
MNPIEAFRLDHITCPFCGWKDYDSWEHRDDSGDTECGDCGKPLHYERDIKVSYTTTAVQKPKR